MLTPDAILLGLLAVPSLVPSDWLAPAPVSGKPVALCARVDYPPDQEFVPGLKARRVSVVIRNDSAENAVALRDIGWVGFPGLLNWHVPVYGSTRIEKGRTVVYDPMAQSLTDLVFEHGLILPGEELRVPLPFDVQPKPDYELLISYAIVGDNLRLWRGEVLLPKDDDPLLRVFVPANSESLARRAGEGGGLALCWPTMREGYIVFEGQVSFQVRFPLVPEFMVEATGGIGAREAARRAGFPADQDVYHYFQPYSASWLLVRAKDGVAVTLARDGDEWRVEMRGGRYDVDAPVVFGAAGDGATWALLDPETFGDLVEVKLPKTEMYYDPGATRLSPRELDLVLERASTRGMDVRLVEIDPNGFGFQQFLAIGVVVDAAGRRPGMK